MAEAADTRSILAENLLDAGCDRKLTEQVETLVAAGKTRESLGLLTKHRRALLDRCHAEQKRLDCLDYLIYRLEKDKEGEGKYD